MFSPDLGWRDIQHLIVLSSNPRPLLDNTGWTRTAAGLWYNTGFGFGLMNADRFVALATSNWTNVQPDQTDSMDATFVNGTNFLQSHFPVYLHFAYNGSINSVEHIEVRVTISYPRRGAIAIYLTSPLDTTIQLLSPRRLDRSASGFVEWPLMSVATWGEDPRGVWRLLIVDQVVIDYFYIRLAFEH